MFIDEKQQSFLFLLYFLCWERPLLFYGFLLFLFFLGWIPLSDICWSDKIYICIDNVSFSRLFFFLLPPEYHVAKVKRKQCMCDIIRFVHSIAGRSDTHHQPPKKLNKLILFPRIFFLFSYRGEKYVVNLSMLVITTGVSSLVFAFFFFKLQWQKNSTNFCFRFFIDLFGVIWFLSNHF